MVYLIYIVFSFALGFCLGWMYVKVKMPAAVPPPPVPPIKQRDFNKDPYTMDEVIRCLTPHDDQGGEWYCSPRQPKMAWRLDKVDAEGLIVCKMVHDMREHTISTVPSIYAPSTVEELAEKFIEYNFRFVADFDKSEWN